MVPSSILGRMVPRPRLHLALAVFSAAAGGIHLAVTREHFQEDWLFGLFFLVLGVWQVAWAWLEWVDPSVRLHIQGAGASVAVVLVWAVSRTVGLPFGPHPGVPERVGPADVLASVLEILLVAGCAALAREALAGAPPEVPRPRPVPPRADLLDLDPAAGPRVDPPADIERWPRLVTVVEAAFITGSTEDALRERIRSGALDVVPLERWGKGADVLFVRTDDLWVVAGVRAPKATPTLPTPAGRDRRRIQWAAAVPVALFTVLGVLFTDISGGHAGIHLPMGNRAEASQQQAAPGPTGAKSGGKRPTSASSKKDGKPAGVKLGVDGRAVLKRVDGTVTALGPGVGCSTFIDPGWTGSCGKVSMAGGRVIWLVEQPKSSGSCCSGFVVGVLSYSDAASGWVSRLLAQDIQGDRFSDVAMKAVDLTGDGKPELVAGFRDSGRASLTYEIVRYAAAASPRVVVSSSLDGAVTVGGGSVQTYQAVYPSGESHCCPSAFRHSVVSWTGSGFVAAPAGEVAPGAVPASFV